MTNTVVNPIVCASTSEQLKVDLVLKAPIPMDAWVWGEWEGHVYNRSCYLDIPTLTQIADLTVRLRDELDDEFWR